jgi:hypothetical protein
MIPENTPNRNRVELEAEIAVLRGTLMQAQEALALVLPVMRGHAQLIENVMGVTSSEALTAEKDYRTVKAAVLRVTAALAVQS